MLAWWPGTASYTRQPTAELHTIGSPAILSAILDALHQAGARPAEPGEFTLRAFLAGRIDLTQAEAVLGVIDARSHRELDVALQQLAGGLGHQLMRLRSDLLDALAHVEAELDFVEDDIEFIAPAALIGLLERTATELNQIAQHWTQRELATTEARLVLRGLPNVGKSSLLNALAGEAAAIVSNVPGTTRDYLVRTIVVANRSCQLIDTAGVEFDLPAHSIAATAAQLGELQQASAHLELFCLDATRPLTAWESQKLLEAASNRLVVLTKIDQLPTTLAPLSALPTTSSSTASLSAAARAAAIKIILADSANNIADFTILRQQLQRAIAVSSHTKQGLSDLRDEIATRLAALEDAESSVVVGTVGRCRDSMQAAQLALARAIPLVHHADAQVLVAAELRLALDELGRMVGEVYTDDLLDRIFSRFCIGK
jgi:tRNA modification GTPase